ncbi:hypothetical protein LTR66_016805, partial [Elasticomyces elasticus]
MASIVRARANYNLAYTILAQSYTPLIRASTASQKDYGTIISLINSLLGALTALRAKAAVFTGGYPVVPAYATDEEYRRRAGGMTFEAAYNIFSAEWRQFLIQHNARLNEGGWQ